jgi:tetratricopeptide (TPR) repeat protein
MRKLAAADPGNAQWQRDVSVSLNRVGHVQLAADDRAAAMAAYEESLAIMRKLAAADPGNADWQRDVSVSLEKVGDVRLAAGDRAAALAAYEESLAIMRKLVAADPRNAQWQRDVSVGLNRVGDLRLATGRGRWPRTRRVLRSCASSSPPTRAMPNGRPISSSISTT